MNYKGQLTVRNQPDGMIWQIYNVETEQEVRLITKGAHGNAFNSVTLEPPQGAPDTFPGWRESPEWIKYVKENP